MTIGAILLPPAGTQLRRAALAALAALCRPVIAAGESSREALTGLPVDVIEDDSVSGALQAALAAVPHLEAVVLLRGEKPLATTPMISRLLARYRESRASIVAATYGHSIGLPAVFGRDVFPDLRNLAPGADVKHVFAAHAPALVTLPLLFESEQEYAALRY